MRRYLYLYKTFFSFALISSMAYPADFVTWAIIDFLWAFVNIGFFKVLLLNIPDISGWTFSQLCIPLGLYSLLNAFIWGAFYGNMKELAKGINKGSLDLILTKPVSSQFMVSVKELSISLFPSILVGAFLIVYGFYVNKLPLWLMISVPLILLCSVVIFYSLYFISTTLVFWTNRLSNVAELMPAVSDVARYPTEIFPVFMRFILTYIIPLGLMVIIPGKVLLSLINPLNLLLPVIFAVLMLYISHRFWLFALRHYSSASS